MKSAFCFVLCASFVFSFFLIFGFMDVVIAANHDNETDRLSLFALKEALTHDPFEVLSSWNETVPLCKWQGVICSNGYVASLNLQHQKLRGPISPHIGNLSFLNELRLDNNSFTGGIPPELSRLQNLKLLWLRNNSLAGEIPSNLSACSNLVEIRLSWNILVGSIPAEFGSFSKLQLIQAPRNSLTGSIPPSFGNLSSLVFLGFSSNFLSGNLPDEIGNLMKLEYLGFNDNSLSGSLPTEGVFKNATAISVLGNSKLCGGAPELQLPKCVLKESTKSFSTSIFKLTISIVSGVLGLSVLLYVIIFYGCKRKKTRSESSMNPSLEQVTYRSLYQATDGFCSASLLGKGGFASVYKGYMENNGETIAVKVFNLLQRGASRSFLVECEVLKNFRHRNLVKVLNACSSVDNEGKDFKALIYEYMENGSLDEWLHPCPNEDVTYGEPKKLNFLQRLNIAIDVANALEYLHSHSHESIVHCDLKPSNVLLDDELVGHVSDFGLARFLPIAGTEEFNRPQTSSSALRGSIGYTAPEYGIGTKVSSAGDIFSFGILLLEMFTGKRPTDDMFRDDLDLHKFVLAAFPSRLLEILDPVLLENNELDHRDKFEECVISVLGVGLNCSAALARDRMKIAEVLGELQSIRNGISGITRTRPLDRNW